MNKKEITEIKKQFTPANCALTRLCACYVDAEKNKKTEMKEAFLSQTEEECFKYFEIFRKSLSGTLGKNLLSLEFPLEAELEGGAQEFLLRLKESRLQDDELLEQFYDRIIEQYDYAENYLILLVHGAYDIPGRASDNEEMFDASDEVYEYLLGTICPVNLSKAGLSYDADNNRFGSRVRDWLVELPLTGFLFPAFQDRSTDLHSMLYYTKNPEELRDVFVQTVFGCETPLSAAGQKETFNAIIEETLGEACDYETVRQIHEQLTELAEEKKDEPEPLVLNKAELRQILSRSGVDAEDFPELEQRLEESFEENFEERAGERLEERPEERNGENGGEKAPGRSAEKAGFLASNIMNTRRFEIRTPDVVIQVNPERADLVETRIVDGRQCLVIAVDDRVEVNGISALTLSRKDRRRDREDEQ